MTLKSVSGILLFFYVSRQVEQEKRELEARLGATPPPSPSDRNNPVFLNTRINQLSSEVEKLKKLLHQTEAEGEADVVW